MRMKDLLSGLDACRDDNMDSLGLPIDDLITECVQDAHSLHLESITIFEANKEQWFSAICGSIILGSRIIAAAILETKK